MPKTTFKTRFLSFACTKPVFVKLCALLLLASLCQSALTSEKDRLLPHQPTINDSAPRHVVVRLVQRQWPDLRQAQLHREIIDRTIEVNTAARNLATKQIFYIIDYFQLTLQTTKYGDLFKKYSAEAKEVDARIDNIETLLAFLHGKSVQSLTKAPTLASYLKGCREDRENLLLDITSLLEVDQLLREHISELRCIIEELDETVRSNQQPREVRVPIVADDRTGQLIAQLQSDLKYEKSKFKYCLWIGIPVTGVLIVAGVLLTHYFWR